MHGHNYRVQVTVEGEELNLSAAVDFADLKKLIRAIVGRLTISF